MKEKLIPERLKAVREAQNLSLPEAARRTGIDKTSLWRYEQGEMGPSDAALRILAMYLSTSVDYLTGKTDDSGPDVKPMRIKEYYDLSKFIEIFQELTPSQQDVVKMVMLEFIKLRD